MKLTEIEIIHLIDLHASDLPDMAVDVLHGQNDVSDMHRKLERIRELIALLPTPVEQETRTVQ